MSTSETSRVDLNATVLILLNVIGVLLGYALTMVVARSLSREGFEQYIGAIATLGILTSIGEAGFGKYGLQIVPLYIEKIQRRRLAGYLRFAFAGCLVLAIILALGAATAEIFLKTGRSKQIMLMTFLFLPSMALGGVAIDLLLAFRMPKTATFLARFAIPAATLSAIAATSYFTNDLTVYQSIFCYGLGSIFGASCGLLICWKKLRHHANDVAPTLAVGSWLRNGAWFFLFGFANAWFFKATFFLMHHIPHAKYELAMLAPAFEMGCLILLLSKSTDKFFQPSLAVVLERHDWRLGGTLRRKRFAIIGAGIAIFLAIVFSFGETMLGWYGDGFSEGYRALRIVAVGASIWTLFSMAPTFLLFAGHRKSVFGVMIFHAIMLGLLTITLLSQYGYLGAAVAFSLSISSLSFCNLYLAQRAVAQAKAEDASEDENSDNEPGSISPA